MSRGEATARKIEGFPARLRQVVGTDSIRSFAVRAGISPTVLKQYLDGSSLPGLDKALLIANAANCSVDWLATGESRLPHHDLGPTTAPISGDYVHQSQLLTQRLERLARIASGRPRVFSPDVLKVLCQKFPEGLGLDDIVSSLNHAGVPITSSELEADLLILSEEGLVEQVEGNVWRATSHSVSLSYSSRGEGSAIALDLVESLLDSVAASLRRPGPRGTILKRVVSVSPHQAQTVIQQLVEHIRTIQPESDAEVGETHVTIVFGASIDTDPPSTT